jgi:hypothetical protein
MNLKKLVMIGFLLFASGLNAKSVNETDLIARDAIHDAKLTKAQLIKEKGIKKVFRQKQATFNSLFGFKTDSFGSCEDQYAACRNGEDNNSGSGSQSCWDRCTQEGYGSSTCAGRCGVNTGSGSESCWNKCSAEGYGSSTCAGRCGIDTGSGSETCWDKCSSEGYGSSTCAGRCGVDTGSGSQSCWNKCSSEGYGSSTCAERCGTN